MDGHHSGDRLPPRPGPRTGLPTPPPGPELDRNGQFAADRDGAGRGVDVAPVPRPPRGRCAPLSWRRPRLRSRLITVLVVFVVMVVGFVGERGLDWAVDPVGWLILVTITLPIVAVVMDRDIAAGADWVRRGRKWVDVYALDEIHAERDGGTVSIRLTDSHRRWVRVAGHELVPVPAVWALAFNGMRHSAAAGACLSGDAVYGLGLGSPSPSAFPAVAAPRRGPGRWALGVLLMTVSVVSTVVLLALGSEQAWFGDEDLDFALALALCAVVQLSICGVATGVGNVPMESGLGAIAFIMVGMCLAFGPVAVALGLIAGRGTGVVVGMAGGVGLIAATVWLNNNRSRLVFLLGRALGDRGRG